MLNKVQFRNRIYEGYFIDTETGIITDVNGIVQPTEIKRGRTVWRGLPIHRIQMNSAYGWKKGFDVHHIDYNKLNDALDNLMYLTRSEHMRLHQTGENNVTCQLSDEVKKRKSEKIKLAKKAELEKMTAEEIAAKYRKCGDAVKNLPKDRYDEMLEKRRKKMTGKIWVYNDAGEQKMISPDEKVPNGYKLGRPKRKNAA